MTRQQTLPTLTPEPEELPPFVEFCSLPAAAVLDRRLSSRDRDVLFGVLTFIMGQARDCLASNAEIAERMGLSETAVRVSLALLESAGYIQRVPDRSVAGAGRRIILQFRTWLKPGETFERDPRLGATRVTGGRQPAGARELPGWRPGASRLTGGRQPAGAPSPISSKKGLKESSKGATVLAHQEDQTPSTEPELPPQPEGEEPSRALGVDDEGDLLAMLSHSAPALRRYAERTLREAGKLPPEDAPAAEASGAPPPEPPPPTPPARKPGPRPAPLARGQLPAPTAPEDLAWAVLLSRSLQSGAAPETRPEVGGPRSGLVVADGLVEAYTADGAEASLSALVDCLSARWRDWRPETRAFWRSALAELRTGLLTADELKGLIRDADRREVKHKARKLSADLGEVLAARRAGRREPLVKSPAAGCRSPGRVSISPGERFKSQSPTGHHYTTSRSPGP